MSSLRHDNPLSSTCSVASSNSSCNSSTINLDSLASNKYMMKTLCLHRKSTSMPSKEEYKILLNCGLGDQKHYGY